MPTTGPIVDANVHLWDNALNPVFWLEDRTLVRDLLGDYDSLPDGYTLRNYEEETASLDVRGIVWSDAGAADPVAAAEWVSGQDEGRGLVTGLVSLGDPSAAGFAELLDRLAENPLVHSVRVRLATSVAAANNDASTRAEVPFLDRPDVMDNFRLMASRDLVATIEANSDQLAPVARLAEDLPDLRIVVDHFGWPTDLTDHGRDVHVERLTELAAHSNVATRLDALGTIFRAWSTEQVRPWLLPVVDLFGADRCMIGSDLPIERLRSTFGGLYQAYDEIFAEHPAGDRLELFGGTAEAWYGRL
jgi:predicted TIM-barrel fold metal-dependent hydrolase